MARRKSNNTELGCILSLFGLLIAMLFTGNKKEKTVGWTIVAIIAFILLLTNAGVDAEKV